MLFAPHTQSQKPAEQILANGWRAAVFQMQDFAAALVEKNDVFKNTSQTTVFGRMVKGATKERQKLIVDYRTTSKKVVTGIMIRVFGSNECAVIQTTLPVVRLFAQV